MNKLIGVILAMTVATGTLLAVTIFLLINNPTVAFMWLSMAVIIIWVLGGINE